MEDDAVIVAYRFRSDTTLLNVDRYTHDRNGRLVLHEMYAVPRRIKGPSVAFYNTAPRRATRLDAPETDAKGSATMSVVDVQISVRCAACAAVVPINAHAPAVACWSCERQTPLDGPTWQLLLQAPLREAATVAPNVEHNASFHTGVGTFQRVFRGGEPLCLACRAPMSTDDLCRTVSAEQPTKLAHCTSCGHGVLVRVAPPELASVGVVALVGESEEQLAGATRKREPVPLACTGCGGSLSVDGTSRAVACVYCGTTQYLPDALWFSLRSTPVLTWSLVLGAGAAVPVTEAGLAEWGILYDVISDPEGNLYGVGMPGLLEPAPRDPNRPAPKAAPLMLGDLSALDADVGGVGRVFSMTRDGVLRWERRGLPFDHGTRLAWAPPGYLLVWEGGNAEVMQASDGATAHRFGQDGPILETTGATSLAIDADGSIVFMAEDERILRSDARGYPLATWGTGQRANVVTSGPGPWVHALSAHPLRVHNGRLGAGWDRRLWVQSGLAWDNTVHITSYDRSGARGVMATVTTAFYPQPGRRPVVDAGGNAFVIVLHGERGPGGGLYVFRIAAGSTQGAPFLGPQSSGGVLGAREPRLCGLPDGTLFTLGDMGCMRRFGPNGAVEYVSKGALEMERLPL